MEIRIPFDVMRSQFARILVDLGFTDQKAGECAEIFTVNSLEGVYSHGVNRFAKFAGSVKDGSIIPSATPSLIQSTGAIEQWDGNFGPGPLNALFATGRATEVADKYSIGMVALANTNHWMRAGLYGWKAARKGYVLIAWTNTCPNMPAWGAKDPRLGNNPFVMALPYRDNAIVLDMAMSQFSYGKMETYRLAGKKLPFQGGFDRNDILTSDPASILESFRPLPIGYWKGSGMSLLLDILAAVLSGGRATYQVENCATESGLSQVFIAIKLKNLKNFPAINETIKNIINDLKSSDHVEKNDPVRYPGENIIKVRNQNLQSGIPVNKAIWDAILSL
jgi:3-dehydro-L-gulonate 2-dehydrogenase